MEIEKCQKCYEPFGVSEHKLQYPGTKEKEDITCPECGHTIQRTSNGWWNVQKLTEKQKTEYLNK